MAFVDPRAVVQQLTPKTWALLEPMCYEGAYQRFEVPAGFVTDFASVPRLVAWLIPTYGIYTPAAILHDYFWDGLRQGTAEISRADADGIFRRCLRELGVSLPKRWMMWAAVRMARGMVGASPKEYVQFLLVLIPAVAFIAIPAVVVQAFLVLFYLVEMAFWGVGRLLGRQRARPGFKLST